ncbi:glycosyltransferase family 2 protein [Terrimonas alba]|uniref:glycosyltransferase family 2 protein n=1 Tax=Terrimonas alba TaxID=3349636 RepID=UPI0035F3BE0C
MNVFNNPTWLHQFQFSYTRFEEIPGFVFKTINSDLDKIQTANPLVSIIVAAWNEEINILHCVASLAKSKTTIPLEIIVVNNNSTDKTGQTLDQLHVRTVFQGIQGWGPARQMGMEKAKGNYILLADADCYYPENWVNEMVAALQRDGVACVYGRYAFISEPGYPRWKLFLLEQMKNLIAEVRHFKRPYLNAYGMSMGYVREHGMKIGFVMHKIRGEDGRMCFDLMQYGGVKQVKSAKAIVWTNPRSLQRDGSFGKALSNRIIKEMRRFSNMFVPHRPHDTKTSTNE